MEKDGKMEEENKWKDKQGIYLENSTNHMKGEDTAGNARKHDTVPSTFVYLDVFRTMIANIDIQAYIGHKTCQIVLAVALASLCDPGDWLKFGTVAMKADSKSLAHAGLSIGQDLSISPAW